MGRKSLRYIVGAAAVGSGRLLEILTKPFGGELLSGW
jgi:hypothetical protein